MKHLKEFKLNEKRSGRFIDLKILAENFTQELDIPLQGGDPYYFNIWIGEKCFSVYIDSGNEDEITIEETK